MHNADQNKPIGVFDSGIGGLTIAKALNEKLPYEKLIYFGDTAHLPYGDKSLETIFQYSKNIVDFLIEQDCKMIVIACNSASSAAYLRLKEYLKDSDLIIVNVIDPLVDCVIDNGYKQVGVIATKATIGSGIFERKIKEANPEVEVASLATPLLAPMIEEGFYNGKISQTIIDTYLSDKRFENTEALLLACTHYPLINKEINNYFDHKIDIIDATDLVAQTVSDHLERNQLTNDGKIIPENIFYVSDFTPSFKETAKIFYGEDINLETIQINEH